jgi:hypothetical protein
MDFLRVVVTCGHFDARHLRCHPSASCNRSYQNCNLFGLEGGKGLDDLEVLRYNSSSRDDDEKWVRDLERSIASPHIFRPKLFPPRDLPPHHSSSFSHSETLHTSSLAFNSAEFRFRHGCEFQRHGCRHLKRPHSGTSHTHRPPSDRSHRSGRRWPQYRTRISTLKDCEYFANLLSGRLQVKLLPDSSLPIDADPEVWPALFTYLKRPTNKPLF